MFTGLGDQLLQQEVVYEQYRGANSQQTAEQAQTATEGAITEITTNTLVPTRSGSLLNLELPQGLSSTSDPTFNTVDVVDSATTRTNLGLGAMATVNAVAAVADLTQTITNPPTQTEVTNIQNKINELLGAMRTAAHLTP